MRRILVAAGSCAIVLLLAGCCCVNGPYATTCNGSRMDAMAGSCGSCGDCGGGCGHGCLSSLLGCGSGCGEVYWGEWMSDPPDCCDPCDNCGNWIGSGCCGWSFCNLFSPFHGLWGGRYGDVEMAGMVGEFDPMATSYDDVIFEGEGQEVIVSPDKSAPSTPQQPTPAERPTARIIRPGIDATTMVSRTTNGTATQIPSRVSSRTMSPVARPSRKVTYGALR